MMDRVEKRIFRNNIIKFVIGIILLGMCYGYIQNHPAEKESVFSGFEVLWQRVNVRIHQETNSNSAALQEKYSDEQTYDELVKMAASKTCVDVNIVTELNETFLNLKKESLSTLAEDHPGYMRKATELKSMIENCTTK
jgi:predicted negative regulator of RcsB-dependent stress response